jgi:hypothetical protein
MLSIAQDATLSLNQDEEALRVGIILLIDV